MTRALAAFVCSPHTRSRQPPLRQDGLAATQRRLPVRPAAAAPCHSARYGLPDLESWYASGRSLHDTIRCCVVDPLLHTHTRTRAQPSSRFSRRRRSSTTSPRCVECTATRCASSSSIPTSTSYDACVYIARAGVGLTPWHDSANLTTNNGTVRYEWENLDFLVNTAGDLGLRLIVVIGSQYPPAWLTPGRESELLGRSRGSSLSLALRYAHVLNLA